MNNLVDQKSVIASLIGAKVSFIQFILDYLIIGLDERGAFSILVWPVVRTGGVDFRFGLKGYRDILCELIGDEIEIASIDKDEVIYFKFRSGKDFFIPLKEVKHKGERAILTGPDHFLFVF